MVKLLVKLTPLEPYFFGGDRTFPYVQAGGQRSGGYFIRSLDTPSQTTLFGVLRYLGMQNRNENFGLCPSDKARIGAESYDILNPPSGGKGFGLIDSISPLYLLNDGANFYIKTPLDHQIDENQSEYENYNPFSHYSPPIETNEGTRCFPEGYDGKTDLADSWMSLSGLVHKGIFKSVGSVGIDKYRPDSAFFKREFKRISGFSFAFFARVDEGFTFQKQIVYLGQKKSAFSAEIIDGLTEPVFINPDSGAGVIQANGAVTCLRSDIAYAQSDVYIKGSDDIRKLYNTCEFVLVQAKGIRTLTTVYGKKLHRERHSGGGPLIRLIRAGSIFIPHENEIAEFTKFVRNGHARTAGFNHVIYKGKDLGEETTI